MEELPQGAPPPVAPEPLCRRATLFNEEDGTFCAEYDNTVGAKHTMRLESTSYDEAVEELNEYLGISEGRDEAGNVWEID